jgi:transcription-repair coupling factor (superfamily II helicase)
MALAPLLDAIERLPAFVRLYNTMPAPGERRTIGGLPGSADASVLAALARRLTTRFFVVATESVTEAERWLADLGTLVDETPIALYPPREGFGEAEPHMEIAGERVETLERLTRGDIHVLITTARALLERTRMPRALRELRVELRKGGVHRLEPLAAHLESIGFERVPMVEDVAQFSICLLYTNPSPRD